MDDQSQFCRLHSGLERLTTALGATLERVEKSVADHHGGAEHVRRSELETLMGSVEKLATRLEENCTAVTKLTLEMTQRVADITGDMKASAVKLGLIDRGAWLIIGVAVAYVVTLLLKSVAPGALQATGIQ